MEWEDLCTHRPGSKVARVARKMEAGVVAQADVVFSAEGGYAGGLLTDQNGEKLWLPWVECRVDEECLFSEMARDWTLKDGTSTEEWRRISKKASSVLKVAKFDLRGSEGEESELSSSRHLIDGPALALGEDGEPVVAWVEREAEEWRLFVYAKGRMECLARKACFPSATLDPEGRVWVAWQSTTGRKGKILASYFEEGKWSPVLMLSPSEGSHWRPSLASGEQGVWLGWDCFMGDTYEVFVRHCSRQGKWGHLIRLSNGEDFDIETNLTMDDEGRA